MRKTIGGDRLGAGKRMKVDLHGYERSTHNIGYLWRSTMSAGTLVPFMCKVGLPGDTFDIDLEVDVKTHPTVGPLFGSYKVQLDVLEGAMRLYNGPVHNNKLKIGMKMSDIKIPQMRLYADSTLAIPNENVDNWQINPSCILSYIGVRGVGYVDVGDTNTSRLFNGTALLMYWDSVKNYYSNKQEDNAYVIHAGLATIIETVDGVEINGHTLPFPPGGIVGQIYYGSAIEVTYTGATPDLNQIIVVTSAGQYVLADVMTNIAEVVPGTITGNWTGPMTFASQWKYTEPGDLPITAPKLVAFPLENIDTMRELILQDVPSYNGVPFIINDAALEPYSLLLDKIDGKNVYNYTQEGLAVKTYQSDLFNNWVNTEWIDGVNGINEITAIDTSGGSFEINTLLLGKKVYDMLNRIAISGGTFEDWVEVNYDIDTNWKAETPVYQGGLIRELVFQEVVSNAEAEGSTTGTQPLGTLAGKGVMGGKKKGGRVTIRLSEPAYIMGIVSITPRIDYSQGNEWDVNLETWDDLHKPALDEIGYQDLIEEPMAWWTTKKTPGTAADAGWVQKAAGKQPAWINYMTSVNRTYGNFAVPVGETGGAGEMFMTLNRRYEKENDTIKDLTTYIDPVKFNDVFAETAIDAQNFWVQISVDITARRKMSAKLMPNL